MFHDIANLFAESYSDAAGVIITSSALAMNRFQANMGGGNFGGGSNSPLYGTKRGVEIKV